VHHGFLEQDVGNYSVLKLTETARPLLRGECSLQMAAPRHKAGAIVKPKKQTAMETEYDQGLFEHLRKLRKEKAEAAGVPPFVIFSDKTLVEMAARRPTDEQAFLAVHGIGLHKLQRFGADFMAAIRDFGTKK
jgi:ATP-dependent DNA helicase RecQ